MTTILASLLTFILFITSSTHFLLAVGPVDKVITCNSSACVQDSSTPFFYENNIYPGFYVSKQVYIQNTRSGSCNLNFSTQADEEVVSRLPEQIMVSVTSNLVTHYSGSLDSLFNSSNHSIGQLNSGQSATYLFTASFNQSAGNEFQNLTALFDLNFNFECLDEPTPTNTPTPTPTPVQNPSSGVLLNEIMPHPSSGNEWVEIYNQNSFPIVLTNWGIGRSTSTTRNITPSLSIPANSYAIFETADGFFTNDSGLGRLIDHNGIEVDRSSLYPTTSTSYSWSKQPDNTWCQTSPSRGTGNNLCIGSPTTTPTPTPTSGGSVAGATSSNNGPSTCSDTAPSGAPTLLSAVPGFNSVTLNWSEGTGPISYYLIAYGTSTGVYQYGNPNIGGAGTRSYTVGSLSPGQTYYFVVRAGNGCSSGPFSQELSARPSGGVVIPEGQVAAGFQPGVLGTNTEVKPTSVPFTGDILGTDTNPACQGRWIPILFIFAFFINSLLVINSSGFSRLLLPLIISVTAYLVDRYFLNSHCCQISLLCRFYWLGCIASYLIPELLFPSKKT